MQGVIQALRLSAIPTYRHPTYQEQMKPNDGKEEYELRKIKRRAQSIKSANSLS
jgi:hypothetical protein